MASTASFDGDPGRARPGRALVGSHVRVGDIEVGHVSDVLYDRTFGHLLGLVVHDRANRRQFLPWAAAVVEGDDVLVRSPLSLLSETELAFYMDNGATSLAELLLETDVDIGMQGGDAIALGGSG